MNGYNDKGEKLGHWVDYWESNKLFSEGIYLDDKLHGVFDYYFNTGVLCSRRNYLNDKLHGLTEHYKYNGKLKTKQYNL